MNLLQEIEVAARRIEAFCLKTALLHSPYLSQLIDGRVYLKMESEQYTGSFKMRGAMNKILSLSIDEKQRGIVTASTGNHALGTARACMLTQTQGTIYMPVKTSVSKQKALEAYPIQKILCNMDSLETEIHAKKMAKANQSTWISPYNDPQIIAGQGTIGLEIIEQQAEFDTLFVTVGGGGLISGIGIAVKHEREKLVLIGCQPKNSPEMKLSVDAGKIIDNPIPKTTLSDGSAGGIEQGSITFDLCRNVIDDFELVSEEGIKMGIQTIFENHHKIIEGSAGVAVSSFLQRVDSLNGQTVIIVICGGNIHHKQLINILFK